jgi:hypothetical protein
VIRGPQQSDREPTLTTVPYHLPTTAMAASRANSFGSAAGRHLISNYADDHRGVDLASSPPSGHA